MVRQAGPQSVAAVCWSCGMRRWRPPKRRPRKAGKRSANEPSWGGAGGGAAGEAGGVGEDGPGGAGEAGPGGVGDVPSAMAVPEERLETRDQGQQDLLPADLALGIAVH